MIAINTIINLPADKKYRLIKDAGFDGVILWWSDEYGDVAFRKNPGIARKNGLFIDSVHASFSKVNQLWIDGSEGEAFTRQMIESIDDCNTCGISTMVMHLSSGYNPPDYNDIGLERIRRIVEQAEKKSVNVALENLKKTEYLEYIFDNIKSERLGFCYDCGHHHCHSPNEDLLSKYGAKLKALHLHDNDGFYSAEDKDQHKLPFEGTIDWLTTMKNIHNTGYKGATTLEIKEYDFNNEDEARQFLATAAERAARLDKMRK